MTSRPAEPAATPSINHDVVSDTGSISALQNGQNGMARHDVAGFIELRMPVFASFLENCGSSALSPPARSKREPALGSGKNLFVDWKTMKYMADFARETAKLKKQTYVDSVSHELDDNTAIDRTVRALTRVLDVPIQRTQTSPFVRDTVQCFRDEEMLLNVELHTGLRSKRDTDGHNKDVDRSRPCPHASFTLVLDGPFLGVYATIANESFSTNQWLTPMFPINAFPHAHCSSSLGLDQRVTQVLIALRYGILALRQV
jgi:hypothetical protein